MGVFQHISARLLRSSLTHYEWARSGPRRRTTIWGTWPPNLSPPTRPTSSAPLMGPAGGGLRLRYPGPGVDGQRPGRAAGVVSGPDQVAERLGLDAGQRSWLESLEAAGPPPGGVPLPRGREAAALLARLGVAGPDAAVIL